MNSRMNYIEKLNLNRKGHTSAFKAVTRTKREMILARDKNPAVGKYNPKFEFIFSNTLNEKYGTWNDLKLGLT